MSQKRGIYCARVHLPTISWKSTLCSACHPLTFLFMACVKHGWGREFACLREEIRSFIPSKTSKGGYWSISCGIIRIGKEWKTETGYYRFPWKLISRWREVRLPVTVSWNPRKDQSSLRLIDRIKNWVSSMGRKSDCVCGRVGVREVNFASFSPL